MKVKTNDISKPDKSKEKKAMKKPVTMNTDTLVEKQLQNEVAKFLNGAQVDKKKKTSKKKPTLRLVGDNLGKDHKLLSKSKYDSKIAKKSKLKENTAIRVETRNKKQALKEQNANIDIFLNQGNNSQENHKKIEEGKQKKEEPNKVLNGRISKKKEEKMKLYEMKRLNQKLDNLDINQDKTPSPGKRRRNKNKKLLKKEKLLRTLLSESKEGTVEPQVGKNRPSISTLKKQIESLKREQPESKKAMKRNLQSAQDSQMEADGGKSPETKKEKKKKKAKKSVENAENFLKESPASKLDADLKKSKIKNKKDKIDKNKFWKSENETNDPVKRMEPIQDVEMENCDNKNTPLRERLMNKLKAARFRYLNEQMYTSKSGESKDFFAKDPESFEAYHEGFKQQVAQWPINPVDVIIESLEERESKKPLIIADMGCGEAKLAASLEQHKVHSLDLVALNDRVTTCDMTHTPLKTGSVDVVIFCLSLMGTDLNACVKEANRILRLGGELKIAEVESRFHDVKEFVKDIQKYGFESKVVNTDYSIFCFLDFKKASNISKTKKKKLPEIKLKPCLYKKR